MLVCVPKSKRTCVRKMLRGEHATRSCENGKYARSFIDDSVITSYKIMKKQKVLRQKLLQQILAGKDNLQKKKCICFTCVFINYHSITNVFLIFIVTS